MSRNLEDHLREALRREEPSDGFSDRVVSEARQPQKARARFRLLWPAAAFAATTALVLSMSIEYRSLEEQRAGQQTIEALRIASDALNTARNHILDQ
jgi:hypothetical protein